MSTSDKCPGCGAPSTTVGTLCANYSCYSFNPDEGRDPEKLNQSPYCIRTERDQLRIKVKELEAEIQAIKEERDEAHRRDHAAWAFLVRQWRAFAQGLEDAGNDCAGLLEGLRVNTSAVDRWVKAKTTKP